MAVISVTEDDVPDPIGNLIPSYVVVFTIENRPGSFTVTVPQSGDPIAAAAAAIGATRDQVLGIYGI
jgi:hypothetical protein